MDDISKNASTLQEQLVQEKLVYDSERKKNNLQEIGNLAQNSSQSRSNSPTLSLGKVSVADSLGSSFWSPVNYSIF